MTLTFSIVAPGTHLAFRWENKGKILLDLQLGWSTCMLDDQAANETVRKHSFCS